MHTSSKDPDELYLERLASRDAAEQKADEDRQAFRAAAQALERCQHEDLTRQLLPNTHPGVEPEKWRKEMPWPKFSRLFMKDYIAPAMAAVNHLIAERKVLLDKIPAEQWTDSLKERHERVLVMKSVLWPLLSKEAWKDDGQLRDSIRKQRTSKLETLLLADPFGLPHYLHFFGVFRVGLAEAFRSRPGDLHYADKSGEDLKRASSPASSAADAAPGPVGAESDRARSDAADRRPSFKESDKAPLVSQAYLDSLMSEKVQSEVWVSTGEAARETGYRSGYMGNLRSEALRGIVEKGDLVVRVDRHGQVSRSKQGGHPQYLHRTLSKKKGVF